MEPQQPATGFAKSLGDQIDEIDTLLYDAQERLNQARYALETLKDRITRRAREGSESGGAQGP